MSKTEWELFMVQENNGFGNVYNITYTACRITGLHCSA